MKRPIIFLFCSLVHLHTFSVNEQPLLQESQETLENGLYRTAMQEHQELQRLREKKIMQTGSNKKNPLITRCCLTVSFVTAVCGFAMGLGLGHIHNF